MDDAIPSGFAELIGVEWIDLEDPANARARIAVTADHLQPYGVVHGGVYAALAESLASAATHTAVRHEGKVVAVPFIRGSEGGMPVPHRSQEEGTVSHLLGRLPERGRHPRQR